MEVVIRSHLLKIKGIFEVDVIKSVSDSDYLFNLITAYPNSHLLKDVESVFNRWRWSVDEITDDLYRIHIYASAL